MNLELSQKRCLITGARGGLGAAIAEAFCSEEADVLRTDQTESPGIHKLDIGCREDIESVVRNFDPQILIANAAITHSSSLLEMKEDEWRRVLDTNLTGNFLLAQHCGRQMATRGGGSIVFISSWQEATPLQNTAAYTVSKAGLGMLMKNLALELAEWNVRVNSVAPGIIDVGMAARQMQREPQRSERALRKVALPRLGQAHEVADAVLFLASDRATYITGTTLYVDGGASLHPVR